MKVLIYHSEASSVKEISAETLADFKNSFANCEFQVTASKDAFFDAHLEAEIIWSDKVPYNLPHNTPKLKWYQGVSTHLTESISTEAYQLIKLTNSGTVLAQNVSDTVLSWILAVSKSHKDLGQAQAESHWLQTGENLSIDSLAGKKLAILGLGRIGTLTAKRAQVFGMKTLGFDPYNEKNKKSVDVFENKDFSKIVEDADFVLLSIPGIEANIKWMDAKKFSQLKEGAFFMNISRGECIEEDYLFSMLKYKELKGAALDSFLMMPLPPFHEFYEMKNLFVSPHCAGYSNDLSCRLISHFKDNLKRFLDGQELLDTMVDYDSIIQA